MVFRVLFLFLVLGVTPASQADECGVMTDDCTPGAVVSDDPWDFQQPENPFPKRTIQIRDPASKSSHPIKQSLNNLMVFYQTFLSPMDGPKCPHYPTCSQFARESFSLYGPFWGSLMTTNRLTREYEGLLESGNYKIVYKGSQLRAYDPPEQEWLWGDYFKPVDFHTDDSDDPTH